MDNVFENVQPGALAGQVGVRTMHLARTLSKRAGHDSRAADILEGAVGNRSAGDALVVEGRGAKMLETTALKVDVAGIAHGDGTDGALYPRLILQRLVPGQTFVLLQLVGIDQWKSALQRDVALVQRTVPTSVLEGEMLKRHMTGTVDDDQLLHAVTLLGGAQQKAAITFLTANDGLWPGVLKLQTALRLTEGDNDRIASHRPALHTQDGDGPPLVNHHFKGSDIVRGAKERAYLATVTKRYGDRPGIGVEGQQWRHALGRKELRVLLPRVAADHGTFLTADNERRGGRAAVFGPQEERLMHKVAASLHGDGDAALAARVTRSPPLAGLTQGVMQALALANGDFRSPRLCQEPQPCHHLQDSNSQSFHHFPYSKCREKITIFVGPAFTTLCEYKRLVMSVSSFTWLLLRALVRP